jgi:hypothetical protein
MVPDKSKYVDQQTLKLQENPEVIIGCAMTSMWVKKPPSALTEPGVNCFMSFDNDVSDVISLGAITTGNVSRSLYRPRPSLSVLFLSNSYLTQV